MWHSKELWSVFYKWDVHVGLSMCCVKKRSNSRVALEASLCMKVHGISRWAWLVKPLSGSLPFIEPLWLRCPVWIRTESAQVTASDLSNTVIGFFFIFLESFSPCQEGLSCFCTAHSPIKSSCSGFVLCTCHSRSFTEHTCIHMMHTPEEHLVVRNY